MNKWDKRFLDMASLVASWSKDPSTKVGVVVVDINKRVISTGYNGFPKGCLDDESLYNERELKYARVIHAEVNAILFAKTDLTGHTIYITAPPCSTCSGIIIQSGITIVKCYAANPEYLKRWAEDLSISVNMFEEAVVNFQMISEE